MADAAAWDAVKKSMHVEANRLESFNEFWPLSKRRKCNPRNLAKAGFVHLGSEGAADLTECYLCKKQLDGWEPADDPAKEHELHAPRCPTFNFDQTEARLQTFGIWPEHLFKATRKEFAEAGFVHVPIIASPDQLMCFSCGKCLDGWEESDDPFEEHLSHGKQCAFIKALVNEREAAQAKPEKGAAQQEEANAEQDDEDEDENEVEKGAAAETPTSSPARENADAASPEAPATVKGTKAGKRSQRQTTTRKGKTTAKKVKVFEDVTNTEQEAPAAAKKQEPAHVAGLSMDDADAQDMTVSDFLKAKRDEEVQRTLRAFEAKINSFREAATEARAQLASVLEA